MKLKGIKLNGATLKNVAKSAGKFVEKNAPIIAAGAAIAGMVSAVVLAIKAGPDVQRALEEAEIKKNEKALNERIKDGNDETPIENLTWKEKGLVYAKYYWKTVLLVLLSAACMITSVSISNKRLAAMGIIAAAAESNLSDLENAAKEVMGEKNWKKVSDKLVENGCDEDITEDNIAQTGNGKVLCKEYWYGTYFWSDISAVKVAEAEYYNMYVHSKQVYMEDFYHLLNIPVSHIPQLAGEQGHFSDPEEGIEYAPDFEPVSTIVKIHGVETQVYVIKVTRPKTYDDLLNEIYARHRFR